MPCTNGARRLYSRICLGATRSPVLQAPAVFNAEIAPPNSVMWAKKGNVAIH